MAPKDNTKKNPVMHLVAGGAAGVVESSCCHPLDTVKTRMQLRSKGGSTKGPIATASRIVSHEGFFALYKGLSAVMAGIVPKMAVRFSSFETYKEWLGASASGSKGESKNEVRNPGLRANAIPADHHRHPNPSSRSSAVPVYYCTSPGASVSVSWSSQRTA